MRAHEYRRQAKSQWRPSSREMSSLEKVRPCMRPRFLSQKTLQKLPLKKMPSTQAHATSRSAKLDSLQAAAPFRCMHCRHSPVAQPALCTLLPVISRLLAVSTSSHVRCLITLLAQQKSFSGSLDTANLLSSCVSKPWPAASHECAAQ